MGDVICIRGLVLRCVIGTEPQERTDEQDVVATVELDCDLRRAGRTDQLSDTINYKALKDDLVTFARGSRFYLVEKLAEEVARICLARRGVRSVTVAIEKPGALTGARSVGVRITRKANGRARRRG